MRKTLKALKNLFDPSWMHHHTRDPVEIDIQNRQDRAEVELMRLEQKVIARQLLRRRPS